MIPVRRLAVIVSICLLATFTTACATPIFAVPTSAPASTQNPDEPLAKLQPSAPNRLEKLTGAWNVEIETPNQEQGPVPALLVFTSDGTVIGDEPPSPFESPAFGSWVSTGPQEAAYTFVAIFGSPEGKFTARLKVVGMLQYDASTDSWSGPFKIEIVDPSGDEVFSDRGTLSGTRIAVETLD